MSSKGISATVRTVLHHQPCPACLRLAIAGPSRQFSTTPPSHRAPAKVPKSASIQMFKGGPIVPKTRAPKVFTASDFASPAPPTPQKALSIISNRLPEFIRSRRILEKLSAYGFSKSEAKDYLELWNDHVEAQLDGLSSSLENPIAALQSRLGWDIEQISYAIEIGDMESRIESVLLQSFLRYTTNQATISPLLKTRIQTILKTMDLSRLPFESQNLPARSISRSFHLHMGPTNSGKTYNALKALSKARTGAYAGPLRLLAHEVWERLNLGTVGDLNGKGRACNLITGEERRIVDESAGLMSCTVEMLPLSGLAGGEAFDVAVIDEIQMLGDTHRGGAWTNAVIGLKAKEIHLCGDETTVELLKPLIASLGDTLTIHRYNRLTPLTVSAKSLDGDFNNAEPGDCFVTFSRTNIFAVKKLVEEKAGRKCAVVYGALPPETRAEQARDFNEGKAEVLVASDAVGMGLNLKIKRIVFESLHKFNGQDDVPLALTQIKQIAGRAGRFGMHTTTPTSNANGTTIEKPAGPDEIASPGGEVTTLHEVDLPVLKGILPMPLPSIKRATLEIPNETLADLAALLPPTTTYAELLDHVSQLAVLPPFTTLGSITQRLPIAEVLEPFSNQLDLFEFQLFGFAPVNHRNQLAMGIFSRIISAYTEDGLVSLEDTFEESRLLKTLSLVEGTLTVLPPLPPVLGIGKKPLVPPILVTSIPLLETLHKSLVLYIWLSFRIPLAFPDRSIATDFKERTEIALDACLERLPGLRNKKHYEFSKKEAKSVAKWRRGVAPNGTIGDAVDRMRGGERKGIRWDDRGEMMKRGEMWRNVGVLDRSGGEVPPREERAGGRGNA